ncbi:ribonuclease P [Roseovarius albus]|uniref:Ribonuclease P protein component n=1 Tax=Roseovarius albus TaxID=1247867 RepID=A0A1X6YXZ9_9RHOB|nr:ribonuclease P protein component [Roseovarius albus]SLN35010.1 ribonuclease P [Roseovarius albus]
MKPPGNSVNHTESISPAASVCLEVLRKRPQFIAASKAKWRRTPSMTVQARPRDDDKPLIGIGFTCSKKVGNAVARNRAKRRLREVARAVLPNEGRAGWDYVLIGRANETAGRPFETLITDLQDALKYLHKSGK